MSKVYKPRVHMVFKTIALCLVPLLIPLFVVKEYLLEYLIYATIGIAILAVLITVYVINDSRLIVIVDGKQVTFARQKKENIYNIDSCTFVSSKINSSTYTITVTAEDSTKEVFDCSYLGHRQYLELLEDLRIPSDRQSVYHENK